jgi:hypothetical protein
MGEFMPPYRAKSMMRMMIGIGIPSSQSKIPRPMGASYCVEYQYQFFALNFVPCIWLCDLAGRFLGLKGIY